MWEKQMFQCDTGGQAHHCGNGKPDERFPPNIHMWFRCGLNFGVESAYPCGIRGVISSYRVHEIPFLYRGIFEVILSSLLISETRAWVIKGRFLGCMSPIG